MKTTKINVQGMTCANCVTHVQKALEAVEGVQDVQVTGDSARVTHDNVDDETLLRAIAASGGYKGRIDQSSTPRSGANVATLIGFGFWLLACVQVSAADHMNLEEGLPTQVEDAYPIAFRGREFQTSLQYERTDDHKDRFVIDPRVEFGFAPNWQGKISAPFFLGSADKTDSGNIGLETLYNFNTEGLLLPAFALSARADLPTGRDSAGIDTTLKAILTKSITKSGSDRVHLNLAWKHNAGAHSNHRDDLYRTIIGYSRRLDADTVIVADFIREQEIERKKEANIFEIGVRRQLTPLTLIAVGLGAGVGDNSPKFRATLGFQRSF
jgi:copper chaperone CopZ